MIPTSTNVAFSVKSRTPIDADAVIVFATDNYQLVGDAVLVLSDTELKAAMRLVSSGIVKGKVKEIDFDVIEPSPGQVQRVYVAGLGSAEKITAETVRQAAGAAFKCARRHRLDHVAIVPPVIHRGREAVGTEAVVTGLSLAAFDYAEYKGSAQKPKKKGPTDANPPANKRVNVVILSSDGVAGEVKKSLDRGRIISDAQNYARTIASRPGNDIDPPALARVATQLAKEVGLSCRVIDEKEMQRLGMGGILAVGSGSTVSPPRMIILEHRGKAARAKAKTGPVLIVGKAITFDTGGISIKPAEKMGKMIFDKCGGTTVLGLMCAIAKLKLPLHVVGILSSAENHVSDHAYRPGDILKMYNGVTVEVTNTDAEGRLVLGDALAWGIETYKPSVCIDLATLTGGVITALGRGIAGVMSNNDSLVAQLTECGQAAGEPIWRLPLGPEQREQIKSEPADIVNSAGREAHPLQGGAFLSYFIPDDGSLPWAHLDIAGVADTEKELPYYAKGATGWGVRTLLNWVENAFK